MRSRLLGARWTMREGLYLSALALTVGLATTRADAAVQWQLRGEVAPGSQFASVADAEHVHVISERYVRLDSTGAIVLDEADVADEQQGGLAFYPAIASAADGSIHLVTRHGGDFSAGHELRYRRRDGAGAWGDAIVIGGPASRNYVVGVTVTPTGRVLVAHSRAVEDVDSVMALYEVGGAEATLLGETPSGWLRADNDFRLAQSGAGILLASGAPGPESPFHVAFASDGDGDVLAQWSAAHAEHAAGEPRRGGPATHVDASGAIHLVYGAHETLYYARYDAAGALVAGDTAVMSDLGAWHLSYGIGTIVASADGARVLVVGLQNPDGDEGAGQCNLLYAESVDGGATFGSAQEVGAVTDGGEGRMRARLERVGQNAMLLYHDPDLGAVALAVGAWGDDEPPGGSTGDEADSSGGDPAGTSGESSGITNGAETSDSSASDGVTTASLPPGLGTSESGAGCGCRATGDRSWCLALLLVAAWGPRRAGRRGPRLYPRGTPQATPRAER